MVSTGAPGIVADDGGGVAVMTALSFSVLMGMAALSIDSGWMYARAAKLQNVADASALGGAKYAVPIDLADTTAARAQRDAQRARIIVVADANVGSALKGAVLAGTDIEFGCWQAPAFLSGAACADGLTNAVRVTARESSLTLFFARFFGAADISLARTAIAAKSAAPACLEILSTDPDALRYDGNITLSMPTCGIHVNGGIDGSNNMPTIDTTYLCAASAAKPKITTHPKYREQCGSKADPYASLSFDTSGLVHRGSIDAKGKNADATLDPGIYSSVSVAGNATLNPGKYVIDGGSLSVKGDLVGEEVTIILKNGATIDLSGNGSITLSAPLSGDSRGFVLVQNDGHAGVSQLGGNAALDLTGTVYLKNQTLVMKGGPNLGAVDNPWSVFVVDKLDVRGNSDWSLRPPTPLEFDKPPQVPTHARLVQ